MKLRTILILCLLELWVLNFTLNSVSSYREYQFKQQGDFQYVDDVQIGQNVYFFYETNNFWGEPSLYAMKKKRIFTGHFIRQLEDNTVMHHSYDEPIVFVDYEDGYLFIFGKQPTPTKEIILVKTGGKEFTVPINQTKDGYFVQIHPFSDFGLTNENFPSQYPTWVND